MCIIIAIHKWLGYAIVWNDSRDLYMDLALAQDGNFKVPVHACTHYDPRLQVACILLH